MWYLDCTRQNEIQSKMNREIQYVNSVEKVFLPTLHHYSLKARSNYSLLQVRLLHSNLFYYKASWWATANYTWTSLWNAGYARNHQSITWFTVVLMLGISHFILVQSFQSQSFFLVMQRVDDRLCIKLKYTWLLNLAAHNHWW